MTQLYIIGAGTPTPTPDRFGSAWVVDTGSDLVMFDCGPAATHKLVKAGLFPTKIDNLFFTHHHFDHDADYPCFLLCRWDQSIGEEGLLKVRGPDLTAKITEGIIGEDGVFAHDWKARVGWEISQRVFVNRGGTLPRPAPVVDAQDIRADARIEGSDWEVRAAPAIHVQPFLDSLAGSVKTEGVNGTEIAASSCHLPQAAAISEISERQRVRKSRRCSASGTWGSPRRRPLKYCCISSNAAQNRDADSKFPKPRIG
jgi:ribonuclease BN (tRNA processing enzyme)